MVQRQVRKTGLRSQGTTKDSIFREDGSTQIRALELQKQSSLRYNRLQVSSAVRPPIKDPDVKSLKVSGEQLIR
jgi:hypothetical protein